jgi:alcohol dehydrogenase class IV
MILPGVDGEPFSYSAPVLADRAVRVVFGIESLDQVASEARTLGARIMIICGRHEAEAADVVAGQLGDDLAWRISDVVQHVPVDVATQALEAARDARAGVLISIGGGSATGLAKAIARETGLPILAVPTTYAGSEMTPIWGQSDQGEKITGRDPRVLPRIVIYDPALTTSMPPELTAASGMNALAHALEALYAPDGTPRSSEVAEEAVRALAHAYRVRSASQTTSQPGPRRSGVPGSPAGPLAARPWVYITSSPIYSAADISCHTPARTVHCCHR